MVYASWIFVCQRSGNLTRRPGIDPHSVIVQEKAVKGHLITVRIADPGLPGKTTGGGPGNALPFRL